MTAEARSLHDLRPDAYRYAWDNSFEPALEIESGEAVLLHVRDASDEQIQESSGVDDVQKLDFSHVNPVSGPVFVKDAEPGDTSRSSCSSFGRRGGAGLRSFPGSGSWPTSSPSRGCGSHNSSRSMGASGSPERVTLPYRPFPGTLGVAPAEPGSHSIVPPSRFGGNLDIST